jgi:cobalt/nickel transport system ATP-binding protein
MAEVKKAPLFEVRDVTFAYPGRPSSLDKLSFEIRRGERLALLGANGSGKTTLLLLLDGLTFPDSGRVYFEGSPLEPRALDEGEACRRFRRLVGFLFQNPDAQLFSPSVVEELSFAPRQLGLPPEEIGERVEAILKLMEITELRDRPPQSLSAGEKKRVALASLLTAGPSVLLLDEPTAGLDPRSQSRLLEILEQLHEAGLTLITATHELLLLPHLADRAVVLSPEHRQVADAPVETVLADLPLLDAANLIHVHSHRHGEVLHRHPHLHWAGHHHDPG